jgi:hypothetical protein
MFEQARLRVPSIDARSIRLISLAILLVLFIANLLLFFSALHQAEDVTGSTLYGLNVLTIALLFLAVLVPGFFIIRKGPVSQILSSLLIAVVGTIYACTLLTSVVIAIGSHFVPGGPIIAITGTLAVVTFAAYAIKLYMEKNIQP